MADVPPGWTWETRDVYPPLEAGMIVEYDGAEWLVEYVNASRSYLTPVGRREVEIDDTDPETGEPVKRKFAARARGINLAPNADVKILRRVDMAKRKCFVCGKDLHRDNKGDAHRACRKDMPVGEVTRNEEGEATFIREDAPVTDTTAPEPINESPAVEPAKEQNVATKKAKKAKKVAAKPSGEGRQVNSYQLAAKTPKEGAFREGSQKALVYEAVSSIGTATAAEVVARVAKKAESKGNLAANVAFYLSKLKNEGYIKVAR